MSTQNPRTKPPTNIDLESIALDPSVLDFAFAGDADTSIVFDATHTLALKQGARERALEIDLSDESQSRLGRYQLISKLGAGGMGVVYRALDVELNREVALKFLGAGALADADFVARFRLEAQSAAKLFHPNIVPVFEIGEAHQLLYFTMALVEGETLADKLKRDGAMPQAQAMSIIHALTDAIAYAHRFGVLHLDLKPANILLDAQGSAFIADFGLTRSLDKQGHVAQIESSGTPGYMAPEQIDPSLAPVQAATDVYGLAGLLFAMLSGKAPHTGTDRKAVLDATLTEAVEPLWRRFPKVSKDLSAVCCKALAIQPKDRYPHAAELLDDLKNVSAMKPTSARVWSWHERLRRWAMRDKRLAAAVALTTLSVIAGASLALLQAQRAQAEAETAQAAATFLSDTFVRADPMFHRGKILDVPELLNDAAKRINSGELDAKPALKAKLLSTIGEAFRGQSRFNEGLQTQLAAIRSAESAPGFDRAQLAEIYLSLARNYGALGQRAENRSTSEKALGLLTDSTTHHRQRISLYQYRASTEWNYGELAEANRYIDLALSGAQKHLSSDDEILAYTLITRSRILETEARYSEAIQSMKRGLAIQTKAQGADHAWVVMNQAFLGQMMIANGEQVPGTALIERSLTTMEKRYGNIQQTVITRGLWSNALFVSKRFEEALSVTRRNIEQNYALTGETGLTFTYRLSLVKILRELGRKEEAQAALDEAYTILAGPTIKSEGERIEYRGWADEEKRALDST
jgi:tetratricopeptide (TPR) repeat protein